MTRTRKTKPSRPTGGESDPALDAEPVAVHAPHPRETDENDPEAGGSRAARAAELDGFLFPGHHCRGGWDGPDD